MTPAIPQFRGLVPLSVLTTEWAYLFVERAYFLSCRSVLVSIRLRACAFPLSERLEHRHAKTSKPIGPFFEALLLPASGPHRTTRSRFSSHKSKITFVDRTSKHAKGTAGTAGTAGWSWSGHESQYGCRTDTYFQSALFNPKPSCFYSRAPHPPVPIKMSNQTKRVSSTSSKEDETPSTKSKKRHQSSPAPTQGDDLLQVSRSLRGKRGTCNSCPRALKHSHYSTLTHRATSLAEEGRLRSRVDADYQARHIHGGLHI